MVVAHPANGCSTQPTRVGLLASLAAWALLVSCQAHRVDLSPGPSIDAPLEYPSARGLEASSARSGEAEPWWSEFRDPQLDALIEQALVSAPDVDVALARLDQARARAAQSDAPLRPLVDGEAGRSAEARGSSQFDQLVDDPIDRFEAGFVATWELDVFGRLRAERAAAGLDAEVAREELEAVRLALSADVADAYFLALGQHLQLRLLSEQLEVDLTLLELIELRFAQGAASAVDLLQQQGQVAGTEALIPPTRALRRVAENRLDVLLGVPPDGVDRVDSTSFGDMPPYPEIGVPARLLLHRPDLRARLADIVARDYDVAASIADRLPRFSLDGTFGWRAIDGDGGFAASLGGLVTAPLTDGGRRRAVIAERRAALDESLAALTATFLVAIEEVDGSLWQEQRQREEIDALQHLLDILESNTAEARNRYANGLTDYLPVLVAVEDVQETQRDLLERERALRVRRVGLHRALGGRVPVADTSDRRSARAEGRSLEMEESE